MVVCLLAFIYLTGRLVYIQIIKSEHYSNRAYAQQTRAKTVEAKRGTRLSIRNYSKASNALKWNLCCENTNRMELA